MGELEARRALVASRLRTAREMAGLSQGQAAKLLGMHRPTITEIEAGRRRVSSEELVDFARLYRVDISWLSREEAASIDVERDRIELAARELSRMRPKDLDRLLNLISALRGGKG